MLKKLLDGARVYSLFENAVGATRARRLFLQRHARPRAGERVLDIGCGPADILAELPEVDYHGFDLSADYIDAARRRFGDRGRFRVQAVTRELLADYAGFDLVLAIGVLHHLSDPVAEGLFEIAKAALVPGGRLVTLDGCFAPGQSPIARRLLEHDRGQFVRNEAGYLALARRVFPQVRSTVTSEFLRVPYTHCVMECPNPEERVVVEEGAALSGNGGQASRGGLGDHGDLGPGTSIFTPRNEERL